MRNECNYTYVMSVLDAFVHLELLSILRKTTCSDRVSTHSSSAELNNFDQEKFDIHCWKQMSKFTNMDNERYLRLWIDERGIRTTNQNLVDCQTNLAVLFHVLYSAFPFISKQTRTIILNPIFRLFARTSEYIYVNVQAEMNTKIYSIGMMYSGTITCSATETSHSTAERWKYEWNFSLEMSSVTHGEWAEHEWSMSKAHKDIFISILRIHSPPSKHRSFQTTVSICSTVSFPYTGVYCGNTRRREVKNSSWPCLPFIWVGYVCIACYVCLYDTCVFSSSFFSLKDGDG